MIRSGCPFAVDIEKGQSAQQQTEKSKGHRPKDGNKNAASKHGDLRQASGFTLIQLTAEFRALRATVFRLWEPHKVVFTKVDFSEIMRFNEAMDQALAESVVAYSAHTDRTRDTFLAMLGHDLRSPLATMTMAGLPVAAVHRD